MGRAPCCDKANVKKGPWSPEEDATLKAYIDKHGTGGNWIALPQKIGLKRCGKSCRLRWLNYLRPNIKHGGFSEEEDDIICSLYLSIGSRWSIIAAQLPGRTDNDIKNYWNTRLKKKLLGKQQQQQAQRLNQEMIIKTESDQQAAAATTGGVLMNQTLYWPPHDHQLSPPVVIPQPNHDQNHNNYHIRSDDQASTSIKKLLIKLGGRFSSDGHHQQPNKTTTTNFDHANYSFSAQDQVVVQDEIISTMNYHMPIMNMINSSSPFNVMEDMFKGFDQLISTHDQSVHSNTEDGSMEISYLINGMDHNHMVSNIGIISSGTATTPSAESTTTTTTTTWEWDDISSLLYPPIVSAADQVPQHHTFEDSTYFGLQ